MSTSFENSSIQSSIMEGPDAILKALSELTAGATLLKAGRSVRINLRLLMKSMHVNFKCLE